MAVREEPAEEEYAVFSAPELDVGAVAKMLAGAGLGFSPGKNVFSPRPAGL